MRQVCIVKGCSNFHEAQEGSDLFYVPSEKRKAKAWLLAVNRIDLLHKVTDNRFFFVCSKHFSEKQFNTQGNFSRPKLMPDAVPDQNITSVTDEYETVLSVKHVTPPETASLKLKELHGTTLQKKVVKLKLPPGISAKEFATSDALKNLTNKLSGLINNIDSEKHNADSNKPDGITPSIKLIQLEKPLSKDISTKSFKRRLDDPSVLAGTSAQNDSIKLKKVKIMRLESQNDRDDIEVDTHDLSDEDYVDPSSVVAVCEANDNAEEEASREQQNAEYFRYQRQLVQKQSQREALLRKIKRQKQILVRRGNELCRYKMQLKKLRERSHQRNNMTLAECMRILKGNMHDHALELLYTQLVGQEKPLLHTDDVTNTSQDAVDSAAQSAPLFSSSRRANQPLDGSNSASETLDNVFYTPKVLEAALLFSVAGKRAYKAMCMSLKLPSYAEIVKWKKIIRSNPNTYRKYFPNLRAKFFKKRRPDEKRSMKRDDREEQDGWMGQKEGGREQAGPSKHSYTVTTEEAERLYRKLLSNQETFEKIFEESELPSSISGFKDEDEFADIISEQDEDIDFDADATEFIKKLKAKERLHLNGDEEWEQELENLNELDIDDNGIHLIAGSDDEAYINLQASDPNVISEVTPGKKDVDIVFSKSVIESPKSSSLTDELQTARVSMSFSSAKAPTIKLLDDPGTTRVLTVLEPDDLVSRSAAVSMNSASCQPAGPLTYRGTPLFIPASEAIIDHHLRSVETPAGQQSHENFVSISNSVEVGQQEVVVMGQPITCDDVIGQSLSTRTVIGHPISTAGVIGQPISASEVIGQSISTSGVLGQPITTTQVLVQPITTADVSYVSSGGASHLHLQESGHLVQQTQEQTVSADSDTHNMAGPSMPVIF